ncbi:hypothetical protein EVAR_66494_1 [Eumeta japonica]|uniref:Uncharacterized protein n=1 Tax=Eumeta variegata TaxID=151549 RepID=A0A4C2ACX9_EUMVA|nr:hypothetical protein EVAR_66494_1 [Eumeta japonica]
MTDSAMDLPRNAAEFILRHDKSGHRQRASPLQKPGEFQRGRSPLRDEEDLEDLLGASCKAWPLQLTWPVVYRPGRVVQSGQKTVMAI